MSNVIRRAYHNVNTFGEKKEKKDMNGFSLKNFGERLKLIRTQAGYGGDRQMREFCREFREDPSVWSQLERGAKPQLYVTTLVSLCEKFDRSPTWLLYGRGHERLSVVGMGGELPESPEELIEMAGPKLHVLKGDPVNLDRLRQQLYALTMEERQLVRGLLDERASCTVSDDKENLDEAPTGYAGGKHSRRVRPVDKTPRGRRKKR